MQWRRIKDTDTASSAPEYVQHILVRLEMAHQFTRYKNRNFLSLNKGPYFVLRHLDELVYRIQNGPNTIWTLDFDFGSP